MSEYVSKLPRIEQVLRRFLKDRDDEGAIQAVLSVYNAIENAQLNMAGASNRTLGDSALKLLVDVTIGWYANPFIMKNGPIFIHVVGLATNAILDATHLYARAREAHEKRDADTARDLTIQANACNGLVVEVAICAVGLQRGWGYAREVSLDLREALWKAQKDPD